MQPFRIKTQQASLFAGRRSLSEDAVQATRLAMAGGSDCAGDSDSSGFTLYSRRSSSAESWSLAGSTDEKKKVGDVGTSADVEMEDRDAGLEVDPDTSDDDEGSEWKFVSRKDEMADQPSNAVGAKGWVPGQGVGEYIGRLAPPDAQCQVLIANLVCVLRLLPKFALQNLAQALEVRSRDGVFGVAGKLLCLDVSRIRRLMAALEESKWVPGEAKAASALGATALGSDEASALGATAVGASALGAKANAATGRGVLETLTRAALSTVATKPSQKQFAKHLARLALEGVDVGDKQHTGHFLREAVFLSGRWVQAWEADELDTPLAGLGKPSNFAVLMDGVPIGGVAAHGRHGSTTVICICSVSPWTHRLRSRFVTHAVMAQGHQGDQVADGVLAALERQPFGLTRKVLRSRLSCLGGDGAVIQGGPDKKNPGTGAGEKMWFRIFPRQAADDAALVDLVDVNDPRSRRWMQDREHLHAATEWDKFHREDIALARALVKCPMAEELYAVCAMMDHMFSLGDGKLLMRAASTALGSDHRNAGLPGMTRKAVTLQAEPGNFLANLKTYIAALHIRREWRREGHNTYTQEAIIDAGRRVSSVALVAFALLFRSVVKHIIAPWSSAIQGGSIEPWWLRAQHEHIVSRRQETRAHVHWLRELVRVIVLLQPWVPRRTLRHLTSALFYSRPKEIFPASSAWQPYDYGQVQVLATEFACVGRNVCFGKVFPDFMRSLTDFLREEGPVYQKAELIAAVPPHAENQVCYASHCACCFLASQEERLRNDYFVRYTWHPRRRRDGPHARRRTRAFAGWVVKAPRGAVVPHAEETCGRELHYSTPSPIRFHWRGNDEVSPPGVSVHNRFRPRIVAVPAVGGYLPSCQVPKHIPSTFRELDEALVAIGGFLDNLKNEETKLLTSEGMNAGYARAMDAMCTCFHWGRLVSTPPSTDDVRAFRDLAQLLRPYLLRAQWPDGERFPHLANLTHGWPSNDILSCQYVALLRRIRMANAQNHVVTKEWWNLRGYRVAPVAYYSSVLWVVRGWYSAWVRMGADRLCADRPCADSQDSPLMLQAIASVISGLLGCGVKHWGGSRGGSPPAGRVGHVYDIALAGLARMGVPWKGRKRPHTLRRSVRQSYSYEPAPAGLGVLMLPGCAGRVVRVVGLRQELDWSAVSASIDGHPYFSREGMMRGRLRPMWHVVDIHNYCRPMGAAEACCERVGSFMHSAWRENSNVNASFMMDTVLLREAGVTCLGSQRDELLTTQVSEVLSKVHRNVKCQSAKASKRRKVEGVQLSRTIHYLLQDEEKALVDAGRWPRDEGDDARLWGDGDEEKGMAQAATAASPRTELAHLKTHTAVHAGVKAARARSMPAMILPQRVQQTLQMSTTRSGGVRALPLVDLNAQTERKSLAGSALRERQFVWMNTEEGRKWLADRRQRLRDTLDEMD